MSDEFKKALVLNPRDNVAIALKDLKRGEVVKVVVGNNDTYITLVNDIPFGHKFAIRDIKRGEHIIKLGEVIGIALTDIKIGEHVHIHNVGGLRAKSSKNITT